MRWYILLLKIAITKTIIISLSPLIIILTNPLKNLQVVPTKCVVLINNGKSNKDYLLFTIVLVKSDTLWGNMKCSNNKVKLENWTQRLYFCLRVDYQAAIFQFWFISLQLQKYYLGGLKNQSDITRMSY